MTDGMLPPDAWAQALCDDAPPDSEQVFLGFDGAGDDAVVVAADAVGHIRVVDETHVWSPTDWQRAVLTLARRNGRSALQAAALGEPVARAAFHRVYLDHLMVVEDYVRRVAAETGVPAELLGTGPSSAEVLVHLMPHRRYRIASARWPLIQEVPAREVPAESRWTPEQQRALDARRDRNTGPPIKRRPPWRVNPRRSR